MSSDEMTAVAFGEIAVLKLQVAALEKLVIGLSVALARSEVLPLRDLGAVLGVVQINARWKHGEDTANAMRAVMDVLHALQAESDPLAPLLHEAMLYQQAGDSMREPLQSWLGQATASEIEADLRELLRALLAPPSGPAGGGGSRDG